MARSATTPSRRGLVVALALVMLAGLAVVAREDQANAATLSREIIFAIDGSSSIDDVDWEIQQTGFLFALRDRDTIPADGSFSIGIVQWSSSDQQRVEFPLTVIDEERDRTRAINAIRRMEQFDGETAASAGLDRATRQLVERGSTTTHWSICMSTDGVGDVAAGAARARAAGVDRFSVVGIEEEFNGPDLEAEYGPAVFGTGAFTLARTSTEFVDLIESACLAEEFDLEGLEVTQGVQDLTNSISVVAGRPTTVRAFVEVPPDADPQQVVGRLHGTAGGSELAGSPLLPTESVVIVDDDAFDERAKVTATVNFSLPASWRQGDIELRFEAGGAPLNCREAAGPTPNDCRVEVIFNDGVAGTVKVVGVPTLSTSGAVTVSDIGALRETGRRLRAALPFATLTVDVKPELFTTLPSTGLNLTDVNNRLALQRQLDGCLSTSDCPTLYYGQVAGRPGAQAGLALAIPSDVSSGFEASLGSASSQGLFRNTAAHEVAHSLGMHHAVTGTAKTGSCGEAADLTAPDYPFFGTEAGLFGPLLNPAGAADDQQIWGLDPRYLRSAPAALATIAPVGPQATFDLMGYCFVASPQDLWPSGYTWHAAMDVLDDRFVSNRRRDTSNDEPIVVYTGRIDANNGRATLANPATVVGPPPFDVGIEYELRLVDASGAVLDSVTFDPTDDSGGRPATNVVEPADLGFAVTIAAHPAVAKVEVRRSGVLIGERTASPNAPTVNALEPGASSVQAADTVQFSWSGADGDGDELRYHVRYSPDGGLSWETLAVDFAGTSIVVPRAQLEGATTNAIFEVQATDGLHITTVRSQPFTVANTVPEIEIISPAPDEAPYSGLQSIVLDAQAYDNDRGDLSRQIRWRSDRDGEFNAFGGFIRADQLSVGRHVLTAFVRDGASEGAASVVIEVTQPALQPPPPPPDALSADAGADLDTTVATSTVLTGTVGPAGANARWTQRSGPASATIADAAAATTTATFPTAGTYVLRLTATDPDDATASSFDEVTITATDPVDATPPTIACPANVTVTAGDAVTLGQPTVSDAGDANPTVANDAPASFPVGTTTVRWTASDAAGNSASCTQLVTVNPAPPPPPGSASLRASLRADRGDSVPLDGAVLAPTSRAYLFLDSVEPFRKVEFWLDDPTRTGAPRQRELFAPWDFAGGNVATANGLRLASLGVGAHTITAVGTRADGTTLEITARFVIGTVTPPPPTVGSLQVSLDNRRTQPSALQGWSVGAVRTAYIFLDSPTAYAKVEFWLDNENRSGAPRQRELFVPWDFQGGTEVIANGFNVAALPRGTHTVTAAATRRDGSVDIFQATFTR